jgi:preprotein translocase subunit SecE
VVAGCKESLNLASNNKSTNLKQKMDNFIKYLRDTAAELKQVSWPTQRQALLYTVLVIAISAVVALYIGVFDYGFSQFIKLFV